MKWHFSIKIVFAVQKLEGIAEVSDRSLVFERVKVAKSDQRTERDQNVEQSSGSLSAAKLALDKTYLFGACDPPLAAPAARSAALPLTFCVFWCLFVPKIFTIGKWQFGLTTAIGYSGYAQ